MTSERTAQDGEGILDGRIYRWKEITPNAGAKLATDAGSRARFDAAPPPVIRLNYLDGETIAIPATSADLAAQAHRWIGSSYQLDGKSDRELMIAVVQRLGADTGPDPLAARGARWDDQSNDYVQTRYAFAITAAQRRANERRDVAPARVLRMDEPPKHTDEPAQRSAAQARVDRLERSANAWRTPRQEPAPMPGKTNRGCRVRPQGE